MDAPPEPESGDVMPLLAAAALQDNLMSATNDLDRLQRLLTHACDTLMERFADAVNQVNSLLDEQRSAGGAHADALDRLMADLRIAVTALQFQDMANQLIDHTHLRLRSCVDQIARDAMGEDPEGEAVVSEAPLRPNPVTQDEMDAGSVELF